MGENDDTDVEYLAMQLLAMSWVPKQKLALAGSADADGEEVAKDSVGQRGIGTEDDDRAGRL